MRANPHETGRFLIVRLSALGDVVHVLPLLDALRRARPEASIGWVVEEKAASLLEGHPQVDRLWIFPRHRVTALLKRGRLIAALLALVRFFLALRRERYAVTVDAQCNLRSSLIARLSGAPRRIGFGPGYTKEKSHLLSNVHVRPSRPDLLKVERNLELLGPLEIPTDGVTARLPRSPSADDKAEAFVASLRAERGTGPIVALHPGVSAFGSFKAWAPERYGELARRLVEVLGAVGLVTWGPGERELAERIAELAGGAAVVAPRTASILELVAIYRQTAVVVGSDTGPVHLAAAIGVPVIGLYGPKDPAVYAPWDATTGRAARTVWARVHCSPCRLRRCGNVICMPAIGVDMVLGAVRAELTERGVLAGSPGARA